MHHSCDAWEKFYLCFAGSRLALLAWLQSLQWQSRKQFPNPSSLAPSALQLPGPCVFNIVSWCAESSSFFPLSKWQWERSGKQSKCCDLKSCRVKCLPNWGCRMLQRAEPIPWRGVLEMIPSLEADSSLWSHWWTGLMWVLVASAMPDFL